MIDIALVISFLVILNLSISCLVYRRSRPSQYLIQVLTAMVFLTMVIATAVYVMLDLYSEILKSLKVAGGFADIVAFMVFLFLVIAPSTPSIVFALYTRTYIKKLYGYRIVNPIIKMYRKVSILSAITFTVILFLGVLDIVPTYIALILAIVLPIIVNDIAVSRISRNCSDVIEYDGTKICILDIARPCFAAQLGLLRRYIVLNRGLVNILRDDELKAIIVHELFHMKRFHGLAMNITFLAILSILVLIVIPYTLTTMKFLGVIAILLIAITPFAILKLLGRVIERKADEYSMKITSPKTFSRALLKVIVCNDPLLYSLRVEDYAQKLFEKFMDTHQPLRARLSYLEPRDIVEVLEEVKRYFMDYSSSTQ